MSHFESRFKPRLFWFKKPISKKKKNPISQSLLLLTIRVVPSLVSGFPPPGRILTSEGSGPLAPDQKEKGGKQRGKEILLESSEDQSQALTVSLPNPPNQDWLDRSFNFLNLWIYSFPQLWKNFLPFYIQVLFQSPISSLLWALQLHGLWSYPMPHWPLFHLFKILFSLCVSFWISSIAKFSHLLILFSTINCFPSNVFFHFAHSGSMWVFLYLPCLCLTFNHMEHN